MPAVAGWPAVVVVWLVVVAVWLVVVVVWLVVVVVPWLAVVGPWLAVVGPLLAVLAPLLAPPAPLLAPPEAAGFAAGAEVAGFLSALKAVLIQSSAAVPNVKNRAVKVERSANVLITDSPSFSHSGADAISPAYWMSLTFPLTNVTLTSL